MHPFAGIIEKIAVEQFGGNDAAFAAAIGENHGSQSIARLKQSCSIHKLLQILEKLDMQLSMLVHEKDETGLKAAHVALQYAHDVAFWETRIAEDNGDEELANKLSARNNALFKLLEKLDEI